MTITVVSSLWPNVSAMAAPKPPATSLDRDSLRSAADLKVHSPKAVERFYQSRDYKPVWTARDRAALEDLLAAINDAPSHGLSPADYHVMALEETIRAENWSAVEILATDAYLTYGAHLLRGKLDPTSVEPDWTASRRSSELSQQLADAVERGAVRKSLNALAPQSPTYRVLQKALARLSTNRTDVWPTIPEGPALKPGMQDGRVKALRARLAAEDLLDVTADDPSSLFDQATEIAVGAFQRQVGLEADGVVGPVTLRELNRSKSARADQLRANLERWRWLAEDLGTRHIRVNIAEFRLEVWERGQPVKAHDVIVGRTYRKTPVFSGDISYVILNPWWETPHNIARLDKLPAFKSDPASVDRLGFQVLDQSGRQRDPLKIEWQSYTPQNFPFRLRQRPGPQNALGAVKLMFPNPHNVYLHDTPSRELFQRTRRDFSSGCIRVDRPLELTEWVLAETSNWNRERIDQVIKSGRETRVDLSAKVPVHIMYMTAVPTTDGAVRFLSDLYDRDARLIAALNKRPALH